LRIAAVGDIHSPRYLDLYISALKDISWRDAEILIFAGDVIYKGSVNEYRRVLDHTKKFFDKTIVSIFGNEEYESVEEQLIELCPEIIWLREEGRVFSLNGIRVGIWGTRGVLDRPTRWQRRNIPGIYTIYQKRLREMFEGLKRLRKTCDVLILVSHYAVTYETLEGEDRRIWPELGSRRVERILAEIGVDLAIHAHAHRSKVSEVKKGATRIFNVSLPALQKISLISLEKRGLLQYFG